jgi:recombinational DNA repair ATPase RecF
MFTQNEFIVQTQKLIENWQTQLAEYNKSLTNSEVQTKANFDEIVGQLEESISQAQTMVEQAQAANVKAWSDMESATQNALDQIQQGWQKAMSRYQ